MSDTAWTEYTVRYQARRSRQDQEASGKEWAWTETAAMPVESLDWMFTHADDINHDGRNIRNAQVIRKDCTVVVS